MREIIVVDESTGTVKLHGNLTDGAPDCLPSHQMSKVPPRVSNAPKGVLSRRDKLQLALESRCADATIRRWERGESVSDASRERLESAADKLNIPIPPKAKRVPPRARAAGLSGGIGDDT